MMSMALTRSWEKLRFLGRGTYGSVFLAKPMSTSMSSTYDYSSSSSNFIAVKSAFMEQSSTLRLEKDVLHELQGCPEIIQCFGDDISAEYKDDNGEEYYVYNLLLEYAPGGSLADLLDSRAGGRGRRMPEWEVALYAHMLLRGLSHVHEEGFVHCDLKPANILVFPLQQQQQQQQYPPGGIMINNFLKLADFGLAKKAGGINYHSIQQGMHKNRGTLLYSSPESVVFGCHEPPMDIWSFGCIIVEMLIGRPLWDASINSDDLELLIGSYEDTHLGGLIYDQPLAQCYNMLSPIAMDFVRRCLRRSIANRWTANELLNHPFITRNNNITTYGSMKLSAVLEECQKLMSSPKTPFNSSCIGGLSLFSTTTITTTAHDGVAV